MNHADTGRASDFFNSLLDGAVDASFMVKKKGGGCFVLECDGANDAEDGVVTTFRMESVTVGEDEEGNPTTAPVIVQDDAKEAAKAFGATLRGHNAVAMHCLRKIGAATVEEWRTAFYAEYPTDKPDILKVRFQRVRRALLDGGLTTEEAGVFSACDDGT